MPLRRLILFFSFIVLSSHSFAQPYSSLSSRPWKGNAILGNGNVCVVYSDDPRISAETKNVGIQHLYVQDYTTDYIASTSFRVEGETESNIDSLGMRDVCIAFTRSILPTGLTKEVRCFVHPDDAVVLSLDVAGTIKELPYTFSLKLRKTFVSDRVTRLTSLTENQNYAVAVWSNGAVIIVSSKSPDARVRVSDSLVTITGNIKEAGSTEVLIVVGQSKGEVFANLNRLKAKQNLSELTVKHWENWFNAGKVPKFKEPNRGNARDLDFYKRNLYAVKSANLHGQIPADVTGQFLTNNMPQLYPRDAMMSARVFLLTGHIEEAGQIISYWANREIPKKTTGEFFARYDAYGKAVDAGAGARYDEPEWDANGYFIQLVHEYHRKTGNWLAELSLLFELADFLVSRIDALGLLYEGGIVEWTGYLPATNMICAAALKTASNIADVSGDNVRAQTYSNASEKISSSLQKLFDTKRNAYVALRFHGIKAEGNVSITKPSTDTLYLWDTTLNYGVLWGYPNTPNIMLSNKFYQDSAVALGGGVQYFEATDNGWLTAYGRDAFFFPSAASAQYYALHGDPSVAKRHIDWMIRNSNTYGLMPERIYLNESDCSSASPLSWCGAEFAAAVLVWSERLNLETK